MKQQLTEVAAARLVERLLPEKCVCNFGVTDWVGDLCPQCHGTYQVWDEGIVEVVAKALDADHGWYRCTGEHDYPVAARLVLSAIAQLAEAGSQ